MNCERCQKLISDLVDGSLGRSDQLLLESHLTDCLECAEVRRDLESILGFCRDHRGEYDAPANQHATWLRIRNTIETENARVLANAPRQSTTGSWFDWLNKTWQLSLPQLAASTAAIALIVALVTVVGLKRLNNGPGVVEQQSENRGFDIKNRYWQQQQSINYWNARIEVNRARWSPQMRDTFDRNLSVIDAALNDSLRELNRNPHDEVSEEMLNAALNEKISLLKEFSGL